jgi:hypothetical protein
MTLEELIDELRRNILGDRSDRIPDSTSDYLWDDLTLVRYIDEAQRRLCAEAFIIRDGSTPEVTQVTLVAGQQLYPLHNTIIGVISAKYDTDVFDLARGGHSVFDLYRSPDTLDWQQVTALAQTPGRTRAFSTDEEVSTDAEDDTRQLVTMRVYPVPTAEEAGKKIYMRVARLPLERLDLDFAEVQIPEVPELHHLPMLDWAASLALRIVDQDAGNPKASKDFAATFENYVRKARRTALKKMFAPTGWGFGRGGWSWES